MLRFFYYCLVFIFLATLWGCKSDNEDEVLSDSPAQLDPPASQESLPAWIESPSVIDGLAETACVPLTETDVTYKNRAKIKATEALSAALLKVSKQALADQDGSANAAVLALIVNNEQEALDAFKAELQPLPEYKSDYVNQAGQQHYCVKVRLLNAELAEVIEGVNLALTPEKKSAKSRDLVEKEPVKEKVSPQLPIKPQWVASPEADDGIAYSSCVPKTKSKYEDSSAADILAQRQLGQGLLLQMDNLVESFDQLQPIPEHKMQDLVFANVRLMQRIEGGYYQDDSNKYYCSLVALNEESALNLLEDFIGLASHSNNSAFTNTQQREISQNRQAFERLDAQLR